MLTWDEVRQCADNGIEIGSHTYTHDVVSTISDPAVLAFELAESRRDMEARLGRPVGILALPNGQGNARVNAAATAAGYTQVLYVGNKTNLLTALQAPPPHMLSRIATPPESLPETALRIELFHSRLRRQ